MNNFPFRWYTSLLIFIQKFHSCHQFFFNSSDFYFSFLFLVLPLFVLFFLHLSLFSLLPYPWIFSLLISKQFMLCSLMFPCNFKNHNFSDFISPKLFYSNIDNLYMKHASFYFQPGWTNLTYIDSKCFSYIVPMVPMCLSNVFLKFISYALLNVPT